MVGPNFHSKHLWQPRGLRLLICPIRAAHSGTIPSETGLLPSLFLKECSDLRGEEVPGRKMEQTETGVTIVELHCVPEEHLYTERPDTAFSIVALILITVSIGTSVACVYFQH
ncbi:hypothetical protein EDC04DRAFT_883320 [Pisolithus marmoratus]|nr:hypothetical protein EDC04DRAFT_883320 [Pisolithus marmoratus]